jgi:WD40 repeat protein
VDLLREAADEHIDTWLRPQTTCLTAPGGFLLSTVPVKDYDINDVWEDTLNKRLFVSYKDNSFTVFDISKRRITKKINLSDKAKTRAISYRPTKKEKKFKIQHEYSVLQVTNVLTGKKYKKDFFPQKELMIKVPGSASNSALIIRPFIRGILLSPFEPMALIWMDAKSPVNIDSFNTFGLFNLLSKKIIISFHGHTNVITSAIFLSQNTIATSSKDSTIRIWDTKTGKCLHTLIDHTGSVEGLLLLSNGDFISWSKDSTLKRWNWKQESKQLTSNHTDKLSSLMIRDDLAITSSIDGHIFVWDVRTSKVKYDLNVHTGGVSEAIIGNKNTLVFSGGIEDGKASVLNLKNKDLLTYKNQNALVSISAIKDDDSYFCTASIEEGIRGGQSNVLRIIEVGKNKILYEIPNFRGTISSDFSKLANCINKSDTEIIIEPLKLFQTFSKIEKKFNFYKFIEHFGLKKWSERKINNLKKKYNDVDKLFNSFTLHSEVARKDAFCFSLDVKYFLEMSNLNVNGYLCIWDLMDLSCKKINFSEKLLLFQLTANKDLFIFGFEDSKDNNLMNICLYNINTMNCIRKIERINALIDTFGIMPLEFTSFAIILRNKHEIGLYDIWEQKCLCKQYSEFPFLASSISPQLETLMAGTEGGTVYFFKIENFLKPKRFTDIS